MAVSQTVIEEVRATIGGPGGIYHKIEKVLAILETNGWAQKMTIQPKDMLCHPANRGGSMLSFHDVWSKGQAMLSVGLQKKLLHGSIAMELSKDQEKPSIGEGCQWPFGTSDWPRALLACMAGSFYVSCVLFLFYF